IQQGRYGFAAETLYSGVRMGRKRAARALCRIAEHLDGTLHGLRVAQAEALLAQDPLALFQVSGKLADAGLPLFAAEAAALAAGLPDAPDSVRRRAAVQVNALLQAQPLPGHVLLDGATRPAETPHQGAHPALTPRERQTFELIAAGLTNREI